MIRSGAQITNGWSAEAKLAYWSDRAATGCLEWKGTKNQSGYGRLSWKGRMTLAHRLAYETVNGPTDFHILHRCDNPACIEPAHLWEGTDKDNHDDCVTKGRVRLPPVKRGEAAGAAKLTVDQVLAIRVDRRRQRDIAKAYGISQTGVGKIQRRENWAHIP